MIRPAYLLPLLLLLVAHPAYAEDVAADAGQMQILWMAFLGVVNLLIVIGVGVISWFLRGALTKLDNTASDHERVKGELRGKIAVLEERVNGVAELKTGLGAMRTELNTKLDAFRDEWRKDAADLRQDIRAAEDRADTRRDHRS